MFKKYKSYIFHCCSLTYLFVDNGYEFAIVRVYQSLGQVDPNGAQTIKNAKNAGIQYVDGYLYPCVPCKQPDAQVR